MMSTFGSLRGLRGSAALISFICLAAHADLEPGEIENKSDDGCGFIRIIAGITDGFVTFAGLGTGLATSSLLAYLTQSGEGDPAHFRASKLGTQIGGTMLLLSAVPVALLNELYTFSYFFGIGAGAGELTTGAMQKGNVQHELAHSNKLYPATAGLNLLLGVAKLGAFSFLAAKAVMNNEHCAP